MIKISAPGKIHLLGEHSVVYSKPAILAAIDLRVYVTIQANTDHTSEVGARVKKVVDPIIKKYLKLKTLPSYQIQIESQLPIGSGLGSSAAISASYIAALLSFLKVKWNLNLINELTFEAEKVFHGNPSGGDNSTVVYGGFIWFRKETSDLKIIQPLNIIFPRSRNFVLINTGKPKETTAEMVNMVSAKCKVQSAKFKKIFDDQEGLVKQLLPVLKNRDEKNLINIIRQGERNLESIGVVSSSTKSIIREIEKLGGAAKISGAGGAKGGSGMLVCYHKNPKKILNYAKQNNLEAFIIKLGEEGLRKEYKIPSIV